MLVYSLMKLVFDLFKLITIPINIPSLPDKVVDLVNTAVSYLVTGIAIVGNYFDISYLLSLFTIIFIVDGVVFLVKVTNWIMRKIPMLGIH